MNRPTTRDEETLIAAVANNGTGVREARLAARVRGQVDKEVPENLLGLDVAVERAAFVRLEQRQNVRPLTRRGDCGLL